MSTAPTHVLRTAARSHTGLHRKNNQDSGFAGPNFLLIADGMGGHAGGDVASAITVARMQALGDTGSNPDALDTLRSTILAANDRIIDTVHDMPELAGMGTTVTALLRDGDRFGLAHIGDSRAYLLRDDELTLVTHDHTFVQLLVDEGRITPEEADTHPQRSVVMRVLGDVGAAPELDLSFREARPGDRWMLCSDGLTGFAAIEDIEDALKTIPDLGACADHLVDLALAGGGADNVTVVIGDVVEAPEDDRAVTDAASLGSAVGSVAINPQFAQLGLVESTPTELIETGPQAVVPEDLTDTTEMPAIDLLGEPAVEPGQDSTAGTDAPTLEVPTREVPAGAGAMAPGYPGADTPTDEPGTGDAAGTTGTSAAEDVAPEDPDHPDDPAADRPRRRRGLVALLVTLAVVLAVVLAAAFGWNAVRSQYYVAAEDGIVVVYRGIPQDLGPVDLSEEELRTDIAVADLGEFSRTRVEDGIASLTREEALAVTETLRTEAESNAAAEADPSPTDPPTGEPTGGVTTPTPGSGSGGNDGQAPDQGSPEQGSEPTTRATAGRAGN
ncbi:PP2C family protein-serine/threonine phosphatase [Brevibacterium litoralis]|uniref:PP2C family protein-serine/threonine phosphatase n=1 Tax=Brevibacterium litoralis TaxID=3138935 RepID=UPI0032EF7B80